MTRGVLVAIILCLLTSNALADSIQDQIKQRLEEKKKWHGKVYHITLAGSETKHTGLGVTEGGVILTYASRLFGPATGHLWMVCPFDNGTIVIANPYKKRVLTAYAADGVSCLGFSRMNATGESPKHNQFWRLRKHTDGSILIQNEHHSDSYLHIDGKNKISLKRGTGNKGSHLQFVEKYDFTKDKNSSGQLVPNHLSYDYWKDRTTATPIPKKDKTVGNITGVEYLTGVAFLPFFMVTELPDAQHRATWERTRWKFKHPAGFTFACPYYILECREKYQEKYRFPNDGGLAERKDRQRITYSWSKTESQSFTASVGIAITAEAEFDAIFASSSLAVTASVELGVSTGKAFTSGVEVSRETEFTTPARHTKIVYTKKRRLTLRRAWNYQVQGWTVVPRQMLPKHATDDSTIHTYSYTPDVLYPVDYPAGSRK